MTGKRIRVYLRKTRGPSKRDRRWYLAVGLKWCHACEAWCSADGVREGLCRPHRAMKARQRYASDPLYRAERKNHASMRKRGVGHLDADTAETINGLYDGECSYCEDPATTFDHVHPVARGGKTEWTNMMPCCRPCNSSKKDSDLYEWAAKTGRTIKVEAMERIASL